MNGLEFITNHPIISGIVIIFAFLGVRYLMNKESSQKTEEKKIAEVISEPKKEDIKPAPKTFKEKMRARLQEAMDKAAEIQKNMNVPQSAASSKVEVKPAPIESFAPDFSNVGLPQEDNYKWGTDFSDLPKPKKSKL